MVTRHVTVRRSEAAGSPGPRAISAAAPRVPAPPDRTGRGSFPGPNWTTARAPALAPAPGRRGLLAHCDGAFHAEQSAWPAGGLGPFPASGPPATEGPDTALRLRARQPVAVLRPRAQSRRQPRLPAPPGRAGRGSFPRSTCVGASANPCGSARKARLVRSWLRSVSRGACAWTAGRPGLFRPHRSLSAVKRHVTQCQSVSLERESVPTRSNGLCLGPLPCSLREREGGCSYPLGK